MGLILLLGDTIYHIWGPPAIPESSPFLQETDHVLAACKKGHQVQPEGEIQFVYVIWQSHLFVAAEV